jgi:hypothetical protein
MEMDDKTKGTVVEIDDKTKGTLVEIALKEYDKLKDEQSKRIGFRDNMLYVTLGAIGGVVSFALGATDQHVALLLVPWICIVLGWTYIVNDEKISAIGKYLREKLNKHICQQINLSEQEQKKLPGQMLWGWEVEHRSDEKRVERKVIQCFVDQIAFCLSGVISIAAYLWLEQGSSWPVWVLCGIEFILLIILGAEIFIYADFKKGK